MSVIDNADREDAESIRVREELDRKIKDVNRRMGIASKVINPKRRAELMEKLKTEWVGYDTQRKKLGFKS